MDWIAATDLVILHKLDWNHWFCRLYDLGIWGMTLKKNRAPPLCFINLCASFQSHRWIETRVTIRKRSIQFKICYFLSRVTLKLDGWPWKTIGSLCYPNSSFVYHFDFVTIDQVKLELQSGNPRSRVKIGVFLCCMTLKFNRSPWKTIMHPVYATSRFMDHFIAIGQFRLVTAPMRQIRVKIGNFSPVWPWNLPYDLDNTRAPLLCHLKLCASFRSYMWN